jgi:hypothetical protein
VVDSAKDRCTNSVHPQFIGNSVRLDSICRYVDRYEASVRPRHHGFLARSQQVEHRPKLVVSDLLVTRTHPCLGDANGCSIHAAVAQRVQKTITVVRIFELVTQHGNPVDPNEPIHNDSSTVSGTPQDRPVAPSTLNAAAMDLDQCHLGPPSVLAVSWVTHASARSRSERIEAGPDAGARASAASASDDNPDR